MDYKLICVAGGVVCVRKLLAKELRTKGCLYVAYQHNYIESTL